MLRIPYESQCFPAGTVPNCHTELTTTWDEILWAAVTVGRPNRHYVFRHGSSSFYEAIFRWSIVRMALEQSGPGGYRVRRTAAAKTLDPSEKGAVNYFLGMTFCKLFAYKLLDTPWLLHLDVFRPTLNSVLTGRSRPDLVGQVSGSATWHAFECKGRVSPPDSTAKANAKAQAQRLVSVLGMPCSLHIGAVTYFRGDALNFFWRDPPPESSKGINVAPDADAWRYYYGPVVETIKRTGRNSVRTELKEDLISVEAADLKVGVHPIIARFLDRGDYEGARVAATEAKQELAQAGFQPDGLRVAAGRSWFDRFAERDIGREL